MSNEMVGASFHVKKGKRFRVHMRDASDNIHPIHLHRHNFEPTNLVGKPGAGVLKDVVMLGGYQEAAVDFVADNPGWALSIASSKCTRTSASQRCSTTRSRYKRKVELSQAES